MSLKPRKWWILRGRKQINCEQDLELYHTFFGYTYRCRDIATGRYSVCPQICRKTLVARGLVVHKRYYGARLTAFGDCRVLTDQEEWLEELLNEFIELWVGYPPSEWWFSYTIEEEYDLVQNLGLKPQEWFERLNEIHMVIENEDGQIVFEDWEELEPCP